MRQLKYNQVLKNTVGDPITAFTGTVTSETLYNPALIGFGLQVTGTSVSNVDVQLSSDGENWFSADVQAVPALPLGVDVINTNFPYARIILTTCDDITVKYCVVGD